MSYTTDAGIGRRRFPGAAIGAAAVLMLTAMIGTLSLTAADEGPKPGTIVTVAGSGPPGYSGDGGPAISAKLNTPWGLAVDPDGNLFIADAFNDRVRKVGLDGTIVTAAGGGQIAPRAAAGGPATQAR